MKLWTNSSISSPVHEFTVGNDRIFDLQLAEFDVIGSIAHAQMLMKSKLLSDNEGERLVSALQEILRDIHAGNFCIPEEFEDVHSRIEFLLTEKCGEAGKKIHTARSRNDQSLLDIKLWCRAKIQMIAQNIDTLFETLQKKANQHRDDLLPGYTHFQLAMPSSFGLWFGAYAESLSEDMDLLLAAYRLADKNPLGSAAGYGSSFPVDREYTTQLLGFSELHVNAVNAQLSRGKTEKTLAMAIAGIASTLSRMCTDITVFMNQNFAFISLPDEFVTGSSIMPHKKNPDVAELLRAKCNRLQAVPNEFTLLLNGLSSGYHRDLQLTKEIIFPAVVEFMGCLAMANKMADAIQVKKNILADPHYNNLFTVEACEQLVMAGMSFREAYHTVARSVETGTFVLPPNRAHTHTGSIGNPSFELVEKAYRRKRTEFPFEKAEKAIFSLGKSSFCKN